MSKGRTAWEILTGQNKPVAVEKQYTNPLDLRISNQITIQTIDHERDLWLLDEIWAWTRNYDGNKHSMTDYVLRSREKILLLRVLPSNNLGQKHHFLVMDQYYPDQYKGPMPWGDESPFILDALTNASGEFCRFEGTPDEEKYYRINTKIPIACEVAIISDVNQDGTVEEDEVRKEDYTLWDYHRTALDEAKQEYTQYLYIQLSGELKGTKGNSPIVGGDKTIIMYRGEEVDPNKIIAY